VDQCIPCSFLSDERKSAGRWTVEVKSWGLFSSQSKFGESAGHTGPLPVEGLHPTRLKVKREFLFESLLIFKPTQLKRAAWPV
jgi:hypothetical protein